MLVSGKKVYNISAAPTDITYDRILNTQTFASPKFGVTTEYDGVYCGGAFPVNAHSGSYTVGSNAGTLSLQAGTVVLDGTILGLVTNGIQQVLTVDPTNSTGNQSEYGYTEAEGGTLLIGGGVGSTSGSGNSGDTADFAVRSITVSPLTSPILSAAFQPADPLPSATTVLSAVTLSHAGLSALSLYANTTITVQAGSQITLNPGGTFLATARRIENYGGITAPGGSISLSLQTDMTSNPIPDGNGNPTNPQYIPLNEIIYLGAGSSLIARGERIDDTAAVTSSTGITTSGYIKGGTISIQDQTVTGQGVFVSPGALIDVSGGWQISASGKVTGGDGGSLAFQGPSLVINGDLLGQSLVGNKGGEISMTAPNITIAASAGALPAGFTADSALPQNLQGQFVLGAGQLDGSGFTSITLKSVNDIVMQSGTLGPSLVKLATPVPEGGVQALVPGASSTMGADSGTVLVTQDQIGASMITLSAGGSGSGSSAAASNPYGNGLLFPPAPNASASISIGSGATIKTAPTGSITMAAPFIDIAGLVSAPAGTINITSEQGSLLGSLTLESSARVLAEGYNQPGTTATVKGLPVQLTPLPGGSISLTAGTALTLSPGSLVSVSGSSPIQQTVVGNDGTLSVVTNAGAPGAITLSGATINGLSGGQSVVLKGQAFMQGLQGGTLSIQANGALSLQTSDLARFVGEGFDSVSLIGEGGLSLTGSGQVAFGRSLTLNAAEIVGSGSDQITLSAPWVMLTGGNTSSPPALSGGQAEISLTGTWLDVTNGAFFSGFRGVRLEAGQDMTFSSTSSSGGLLATAGDLTLQAARIYPTTLSSFTIDTTSAPAPYGKVTILPSGMSAAGPIYSAGGSLTIRAAGGYQNGVQYGGIDQEGYLAAPLGSISLQSSNGRVYLGSGSITTTNGGNTPLLYGTILLTTDTNTLGDNIWAIPNYAQPGYYTQVLNVPAKSISLSGSEVIVREGAAVDVSGGGSVFASRFVPSYSGSNNPLVATVKGEVSYVIVPGVVLPGNGVYLSGIKGLPAGVYSLLPAVDANGNATQWAFLPGAMVVTDLGATVASSNRAFTSDGYPIVAGYATTMGTGIRSPQAEAYEVRPASVVLAQGDFETQTSTAGAGGSVTITGSTTILNGTILANPLPGYSGGSIALSGNNVTVQASTAALPSGFGFDTSVPSGLSNTLTIAAPSLSGQGFQTIGLGVSDLSGSAASVAASTVELKPGVTLEAENIILGAATAITLDAGAQVLAIALPGDTGQATFISPGGTLNIGANAVVHASNSVNLQTANTVLDPTATLKADHSSVNLQGSAITIYDPAASQSSGAGLFLTVGQWDNFSAVFENITLTSLSDLVFEGSFAPGTLGAVANTLTIDAGRIMDSVANSSVFLSGRTVVLQNTTGATPGATNAAGAGQITLAASQIQVTQGNIFFDGFSNVNLNGQNNVTFSGVGSLTTGGGNLTIQTPRVATSYYLKPVVGIDPTTGTALPAVYTAANYLIDTTVKDSNGNVVSAGTVTMQGNGAASAGTATPGGTLAITAGEIDVSTIVEVPSGQIELTATGNINLGSGGQILSRGYYSPSAGTTVQTNAPGGVVSLTSTGSGVITLAAGSLIDVSAGSQGDAGSISLYAPIGGVALNGNIQGQAAGGKGGSFSLVTNSLDITAGINRFSALNNQLIAGGFNETVSIEASTGNITIAAADYVQVNSLTITADGANPDGTPNGGSIILDGTIDVHYPGQGGTVGLYAQKDLTIDPTGYIDARGVATAAAPDAAGGNVTLAINTGRLTMAGGTIDVSGSGAGAGGTVTFRGLALPPSGGTAQSDMSLSGTVKGASSVVAEIDKVYVNQFQTIDSTAISRIQSDLTALMTVDAGLSTELAKGLTDGNGNALVPYDTSSGSGTFHLRPGVVVEQTKGDITLTQDGWDLSGWRYGSGNEPGTLTLRAAGNLNIAGNLVDNPTNDYYSLLSSTAQPSWGFNLVAGAQTTSPNFLAVTPAFTAQQAAQRTLTVSSTDSPIVVYTESGSIGFASGGNTLINAGPFSSYMIFPWMQYTLATYSGAIRGRVDGSLIIYPDAVIQSATGNIDIQVGKGLDLTGGAGAYTGGDLGAIRTTGEHAPSQTVFDYYTYNNGGSITLDVGGDVVGGLNPHAWLDTTEQIVTAQGLFYNPVTAAYMFSPTEGIAAMGGGDVCIRVGGNFNGQTGTFGQGNLQIYSGGNVTGRFLVEQGTGTMSAMGNFGAPAQPIMGEVQAMPQLIEMGASQVSVFAQGSVEMGAVVNQNLAEPGSTSYWDNGYTQNSSVKLTAVTGDVHMYGQLDSGSYGTFYQAGTGYLPPTVEISAGRDIVVSGNFTQLPAHYGNLSMQAGGNILFTGGVAWVVSDADLNTVYPGYPASYSPDLNSHASTPVHTGDANPVVISAGGDITDMNVTLPKMAEFTAGGSISDLNYNGQNVQPTDITSIIASQDIVYSYGTNVSGHAIQVGGPGYVLVQAGGTIDLGASNGIQAIGNAANQYLSGTGSSLVVAAGFAGDLTPQGVSDFFAGLRDAGVQYSTLQAAGDAAGAQAVVSQARSGIIAPFLGSANAGEDITMTSSQIATTGGGSLFIVATGALNVGTTLLPSASSGSTASKSTGILTETGGGINIFTNGDVNVNEARMMTFQGGDITVWSDTGNINAGKGSKTAVNASLPTYSCTNGVCSVKFNPPQVGSGIRAVTYAPDEFTPAPPAGDIYLFAPQGIIDAGEAGISGGKVFLGAVTVLNVANISFTAGAVGVPAASQTVSLGALTGTTNLAATSMISQDSGALGSARGSVGNNALRAAEDMVKWFDVKFISFDLSSSVAQGAESGDRDE